MVLALQDLWEKPKNPKKLLLREVGTADFIIARHAKSLPSVQDLLSLLAICDDLFFFLQLAQNTVKRGTESLKCLT